MRARISYVTVKRSGTRAVRDVLLDVEVVRIGRGTDNEIQLPGLSVALEHAAIHLRQGRPWIEAVRGDDVRVGGRVASARALAIGDTIRIGPHELRVRAPEAGTDLAVEVEQIESAQASAADLARRTSLGIHRGRITRRKLAWAATLAAAAGLFALPWLSQRNAAPFDPSQPEAERSRGARILATAWSSGPLSASHAHFTEQCNACHVEGFEEVSDNACLACHGGIGAHAAEDAGGAGRDRTRCVDCHDEHRGGRTLAAFPDSLCASCHANLRATYPETDLLDAADFAAAHAEFRPAVLTQPGSEVQQRIPLDQSPREQSGLRFPHDEHLAGALRTALGPVVLECPSCHVADARGETMQAIDFEKHCRRCHTLAFDERAPDRHAVHGDPAALENDLFEFYATRALRGEEVDEEAPLVARRRPGRELTAEEKAGVIRWVGEKTARVRRLLLADSGACATCHVLERSAGDVRVLPARLVPFPGSERWLSRAIFEHRSHASTSCESCHAARRSASATDVLLPGIERCRQCHGGEQPRTGRIASPCTSCHDFHRERFGAMHGERAAIEEGS
ncbi:MAG TPA: FHA domain-containing protein [Candidatus Limnocylindrales bacterium]|nr:FHA domain-containing protein [Candidatus Limnocylindrales bacterium]